MPQRTGALPPALGLARLADITLARRWRGDADHAALDELVRRYEPLAHWVAGRYAATTSEPFEDLLQVARVGLVCALRRFDPERGTHIRSFAIPAMTGEVRAHFRDKTWPVHVPRGMKLRARVVRRAADELARELGRPPRVCELAERIQMSKEAVVEALEVIACSRTRPLDSPGAARDDHSAASEEDCYGAVDNSLTVARALKALPRSERELVQMRFVQELSQVEIAARLGWTQMHVSRALRRALDRMQAVSS